LEQDILHHRKMSAVKRVEFASDRMSYIVLRRCWSKIVFWICMHHVRRNVMIQKTVFMRI